SHAWTRTIDGSQGGAWDHVHLLGTAALDGYRGYTAQSRARQPTHTWNTATLTSVDFGGRLAHEPDPDHEVAAALARVPDTAMAAADDPWTLDRHLRHVIAAHQAVLEANPPTDVVSSTTPPAGSRPPNRTSPRRPALST